MNLYRAFELIIGSPFPILSLPEEGAGEPDVSIRFGEVPKIPDEYVDAEAAFELSPAVAVVEIENVARYSIERGRQIVIDRIRDDVDDRVERHLLGSVWAVLLFQRRVLALHAASNLTDAGAIVILGNPGVGKSTTSYALARAGIPMIADDVTGVDERGGLVHALPGFAQSRLWANSLNRLGEGTDGLLRVFEGFDKFYVPVPNRRREPAPIHTIFELSEGSSDSFLVEEVGPMESLQLLLSHTYRPEMLDDLGVRGHHLEKVSSVANSVRVRRIVRPRDRFSALELIDVVMAEVEAS